MFHRTDKACCRLDWKAGCGIAAGKRCRTQMADPSKALAYAPHEELAAPNRAVIAVARSIERDADDASADLPPLGKNARNVRAMMLDGDGASCTQRAGKSARYVLGMEIVRDDNL